MIENRCLADKLLYRKVVLIKGLSMYVRYFHPDWMQSKWKHSFHTSSPLNHRVKVYHFAISVTRNTASPLIGLIWCNLEQISDEVPRLFKPLIEVVRITSMRPENQRSCLDSGANKFHGLLISRTLRAVLLREGCNRPFSRTVEIIRNLVPRLVKLNPVFSSKQNLSFTLFSVLCKTGTCSSTSCISL